MNIDYKALSNEDLLQRFDGLKLEVIELINDNYFGKHIIDRKIKKLKALKVVLVNRSLLEPDKISHRYDDDKTNGNC